MRYLYLIGLIILTLLLVYCKKEELRRLENTEQVITLDLSVDGIDNIMMFAEIIRDTSLIEVKNGTAYFQLVNTANPEDTITFLIKDNEINNSDEYKIKFQKSFPEAGEDTKYTIQAFATLEHTDFNQDEKLVWSNPTQVVTKDIELKTSIEIKDGSLALKTNVLVDGERNGQKVKLADMRYEINDTIINLIEFISPTDTFPLFIDTTTIYEFPLAYKALANFRDDLIETKELEISLNACKTETEGVKIDFQPQKPSIFYNGNNSCLEKGEKIILKTSKYIGNRGSTTYEWYKNSASMKELLKVTDDIDDTLYIETVTSDASYYVIIKDENCPSEKSDSIMISMKPNITLKGRPFCSSEGAINLRSLEPASQTGGIWETGGMTISNPESVELSNGQELIYTYTNASGCSGSKTLIVVVENSPSVSLSGFSICANENPINLREKEPAAQMGGIWESNGMTILNPESVSVNNNQKLIYRYSESSCIVRDTIQVEVKQTPTIEFTTPPNFCENDTIDLPQLFGGIDGDGTWSTLESNIVDPTMVILENTQEFFFTLTDPTTGCTEKVGLIFTVDTDCMDGGG